MMFDLFLNYYYSSLHKLFPINLSNHKSFGAMGCPEYETTKHLRYGCRFPNNKSSYL